MSKIDWDAVSIILSTLIVIGGFSGAIVYTEYSKSICVTKSLENKLTVTEIQVLCGK